jgi:hypothetical protein
MLLLIECALISVLILFLSFYSPTESWFGPVERAFAKVARKRTLSVVVVGTTALVARILLLPIIPIPDPAVHDEFSYLLAADTFAHGRLTNPTHLMWVHFETFHVNQRPTYASMYYPGQGLFLAAGQVLFGHPFWGVWLSTALMCAGICWMLQGWLPPLWALFGGLLAVIRLGTFSYWANSYWGGAVAAFGGSLVLGALPRVKRCQRLRDAVLMGIGFAILANSRPYEGLFFGIPVIVALVIWIRHHEERTLRLRMKRVAIPLTLTLFAALAAMGFYFWRVTGNPFQTPFSVNAATYDPAPYFPWQHVKAVAKYNHAVMRSFYLDWWRPQYEFGRSHPVMLLLLKCGMFWSFFVGPVFTIALLASSFSVPVGASMRQFSKRTKFLLLVSASTLLSLLLPVYFNPHYAAPVTCVVYALLLIALQNLRRWKPNRRCAGVAVIRAVFVAAMLMLVARALMPLKWANNIPATWYSPIVLNSYRQGIASRLSRMDGRHLIIVRYKPDHLLNNEWVYNGADIDGSKVIWAREMNPEQDTELIRYFKDRKLWLAEPDQIPPKLSPYPGQDQAAPSQHDGPQ